jgi:hypothetical protein
MESKRGHRCATISNPPEEVWETIKNTVATDSDCGSELAFIFSDKTDSTEYTASKKQRVGRDARRHHKEDKGNKA